MGGHAPDREPEPDGLAASARAALVRRIDASGAWAADPVWREAFAAVPRHLFVPYYYVGVAGGYERRWGESPDPRARERWVVGAYEDTPLATRLRDGELLSSSSQPSLMADMLAALCVRDGNAVLEIGAGTGYNAALLAHRLGDDKVTTVDLDPEITESARRHLAAAGYQPVVVTGDGARGVPERAPFDRIIATCALNTVPRAWLAQSRPGGRILMPLGTGLIVLTVSDAGHAEGRFLHTPAYFVPLRGGIRSWGEPAQLGGVPRRAREDDLFRFLLTLTRGSLDPQEAHALWEQEGMPQRERYGITVRGEHEWAWLDDPEGPYAWPLPS
ncbi:MULTISPECIES: methyltransferase domain-containing protein [Streptomyces]|uniref:Protein-L-isoaspartate O-methyltransferase n=1 Tax=Streptomyces koelreuteriae TaxID=2838015 RepID=A0ABX8FWP5_9ACTN|nr:MULTISPECIES: methyltransferase domain-containing protein [Streptomyces]QWB25529.1 methyltransferase domain-containing protein [Streptomyces koelreuteriae]UUA08573.1 methyltransferase domain-containing protein [Streptomyces koelreuteriae]UUA16178.1 methyltransferase domain-containing protein [Streptomyces sp. CRCS-T-1]